MPRLQVVQPPTATGRAKEIFDGPLKGKHLNIFKGMANSPAALQAYLSFSGALAEGTLTAAEREVIALATGQSNDCAYCVSAHTALGKMAGLSEAQTVEARRGRMNDAKLSALATFVRTLNEKRGHISDAELQAVRAAGYDDGQIAEAIAGYALNIYTNYFNHVNGTDVDFPTPPALT